MQDISWGTGAPPCTLRLLVRQSAKEEVCHQRVCSHEGLFSIKMNLVPPLHSGPFQNLVPGVYLNRHLKKRRRKELTIKGVVDSPSFFLGQCSVVIVDIEDTFRCVRCPSVRTLLRRSLESKGGNLPSCGLGGRWFYAMGIWKVMAGARPTHSQGACGCGPDLLLTRFRFLSRRTCWFNRMLYLSAGPGEIKGEALFCRRFFSEGQSV